MANGHKLGAESKLCPPALKTKKMLNILDADSRLKCHNLMLP